MSTNSGINFEFAPAASQSFRKIDRLLKKL
jgi:hypothetical protein